jgi:hypothetical protein
MISVQPRSAFAAREKPVSAFFRIMLWISMPKMQIPAGLDRQGSAERMTDGERVTRWPVMDLRAD